MEAPVVEAEESKSLQKYTALGVISVACGVLGLVFLVLMFFPGIMVLGYFVLALGVLAIVFGAFAYWGMKKDSLGLTGFALGALLVIVWFLVYAYLSVSRG
jgi:uncharacterized membrane protein HdeD (DUF308 family)